MQKENLPIGVFDSGVGGISVLRELVRLMPGENYIYLGDGKNAPYGTKSHEQILGYANSCADYLVEKGIKALVVACNTATSVCIDHLRKKYPDMHVVGIEPAIKPALECAQNSVIAVMATPVTLSEKKFASSLERCDCDKRLVLMPCPGLMEIVEEGLYESKAAYEYLKELFGDEQKPDAVVLGCTHYPFLKNAIESVLPGVRIYDGGEGTARRLKQLLEKDGILNPSPEKGTVEFENTLDKSDAISLARRLLECEED